MKDTDLSLDDIALFLAVCDAGGLVGAATRTGVSTPTLSRKMTGLEQQAGRQLFLRGNQGYRLTEAGRTLRAEAAGVEAAQRRLSSWMQKAPRPRVRITAGTWSSRWLAENLTQFWRPEDPWVPAFLSANANLDISRREADIGIRNRRPEHTWLAGKRLRRIEYAEFSANSDVTGYVTLDESMAGTPSTRWVHETHRDSIVTTVSDARLALDLARAGVARVVLPLFAGLSAAGVRQVSEPLEVLAHDEWLVTHHDARHDPPVRRAIDAVTRFIQTWPRR